ncbi:PIG-L deacetylase family protein [Curvibacter sp. APW13]|uniref:PIG-L deacetylase family protein n=1 Tax=Curvibacter sp. APW13 TaxID=3077236 RepID=UPI0028E08E8C|nr:PIG-L deacetylase family protein [Curvibacter sp. APW13]MDT8993098.1 PIG-L deacetylase family protein [Curvibacter sp. APW13]
MSKAILIVAAHADDEALGCGGTIAKHVAAGDKVHVVFVADGVTSRGGAGQEDLVHRQRATENARNILGISTMAFLDLPDNRLDSLPLLDIIQPLEALIGKLAPEIIYTHHCGDLNVDHRLVHQAVMTACRPLPNSTVREILAFEVMSSTEWSSTGLAPFLPNLFVDISAHMETKMRALEAYALEMRAPPHSRSMEHMRSLAKHRGYCVGVDAAEAFMVMRVLR